MELHIALQLVIKTEGLDVIDDTRIVNILSDYNAFDSMPASKYILRSIIHEGYTTKLYNIGAWNAKSEALCRHFASITGFQIDYVNIVFESLAYGYGWIKDIRSVPMNYQKRTIKHNTICPTQKQWDKMTYVERVDYYNSNTVWKFNSVDYGIEISNFSFDFYSEGRDDEKENIMSHVLNYRFIASGNLLKPLKLKAIFYGEANKLKEIKDMEVFHTKNYDGYKIVDSGMWVSFHWMQISKIEISSVSYNPSEWEMMTYNERIDFYNNNTNWLFNLNSYGVSVEGFTFDFPNNGDDDETEGNMIHKLEYRFSVKGNLTKPLVLKAVFYNKNNQVQEVAELEKYKTDDFSDYLAVNSGVWVKFHWMQIYKIEIMDH